MIILGEISVKIIEIFLLLYIYNIKIFESLDINISKRYIFNNP